MICQVRSAEKGFYLSDVAHSRVFIFILLPWQHTRFLKHSHKEAAGILVVRRYSQTKNHYIRMNQVTQDTEQVDGMGIWTGG